MVAILGQEAFGTERATVGWASCPMEPKNMQAVNPKVVSDTCRYNLTDPPVGEWSGLLPIPPISTIVQVTFNGLGKGIVQGYFIEHGFVGLHLLADPGTRPAWHKEQNPDKNFYLVFGNEIRPVA